MPAHHLFGSLPMLELLCLWIDWDTWCDLQNQNFVKDMFLLAFMRPPGGRRTHISGCLQRRFNMTFPSLITVDPDIKKLYRLAGVDNKPTVFLFNDTRIADGSFPEDISNILSSDSSWNNITELDKLPNFHGIVASFEEPPPKTGSFGSPASQRMPLYQVIGENKCNELQKMLIVCSLHQGRVSLCVTSFVVNNLVSRLVETPVLDMKAVISAYLKPSFFSAPNLSWMSELDKLVEQHHVQKPHSNFRLWLSSLPHPEFPITILQAGIKMTTEPQKGVKANMKRLQLVTEDRLIRCLRPLIYRKMLFSLCSAFFHSIRLERKTFFQLCWNIVYGFTDCDFELSERLLSQCLDEYEGMSWDALKYLIAGVSYGGHVTDDWERRFLTIYYII
ncbi:LOW QUALITY PROTEIN: dynein axonemal heavy chain 2 [Anoplopoma fimbria]|uniref:LOW QUALITY PROTEIN: dynein axonemal heavy chain 2 n=1 Tax=Anoplopoma fimbria TaxID=229290 RepID=UPI0023EBECFF|nr:LOW QUALITY PROTEIN: dynein axonemal heavy chain 2 [Anoplopoma fimbria]